MVQILRVGVPLVLLIGLILTSAAEYERNILFSRDDYEAEHKEIKEKAINITQQICPKHKAEITKKVEHFLECSKRIDEDEKTMCQVLEESLRTCTEPLRNSLENCIPEKAKGLPTYVIRTVNATFKYLCDINGAHFLELGNPCILRKNHPETRTCVRKIKRELLKYDVENLPEKKVLCVFLKDFRPCFEKHVENSCQDSITREAYLGLYETFLCRD